jgi:hypothetical protein
VERRLAVLLLVVVVAATQVEQLADGARQVRVPAPRLISHPL